MDMQTQTGKETKSHLNGVNRKAQSVGDKTEDAVSFVSMNDLRETLEQALESVRDNSQVMADRVEAWVKAHPYKSLMGAVTAGAFIAAIMRRGK